MLQSKFSKFYKVKNGDTLFALSKQLHTTMYALIAENDIQKEVFEGQVLRLPPEACLYTVQVGDTKVLLCGGEQNYRRKNGTDVFYLGMRVRL